MSVTEVLQLITDLANLMHPGKEGEEERNKLINSFMEIYFLDYKDLDIEAIRSNIPEMLEKAKEIDKRKNREHIRSLEKEQKKEAIEQLEDVKTYPPKKSHANITRLFRKLDKIPLNSDKTIYLPTKEKDTSVKNIVSLAFDGDENVTFSDNVPKEYQSIYRAVHDCFKANENHSGIFTLNQIARAKKGQIKSEKVHESTKKEIEDIIERKGRHILVTVDYAPHIKAIHPQLSESDLKYFKFTEPLFDLGIAHIEMGGHKVKGYYVKKPDIKLPKIPGVYFSDDPMLLYRYAYSVGQIQTFDIELLDYKNNPKVKKVTPFMEQIGEILRYRILNEQYHNQGNGMHKFTINYTSDKKEGLYYDIYEKKPNTKEAERVRTNTVKILESFKLRGLIEDYEPKKYTNPKTKRSTKEIIGVEITMKKINMGGANNKHNG